MSDQAVENLRALVNTTGINERMYELNNQITEMVEAKRVFSAEYEAITQRMRSTNDIDRWCTLADERHDLVAAFLGDN